MRCLCLYHLSYVGVFVPQIVTVTIRGNHEANFGSYSIKKRELNLRFITKTKVNSCVVKKSMHIIYYFVEKSQSKI